MDYFKSLREKTKHMAKSVLAQLGKTGKLLSTGKRQITASILSLVMVFTMMPALSLTAFAATPTPLTFTAEEDNSSVTLGYRSGSNVKYNKNDSGWTACPSGTSITLEDIGDTVSFIGTDVKTDYSNHFSMTGTLAASGDVTSLTNGIGGDVALTNSCYASMFYACTGLTEAPELPATKLAIGCYESMFRGCTSLTTAPELPATTLVLACYSIMFYGCTGLKVSDTQTGNYTKEWRIPTTGDATTANDWNSGMLRNSGGPFTGNPEIGVIYYILDDKTAPVITGIEDSKTYCETVEFTVADDSSVTVTANGTPLTPSDGKYTLTTAGTYDVVATDKGGYSTTISSVILNANHTFGATWSSDGTNHWHECTDCGEKKDTAAHTWNDGAVTTEPTVTEKGEMTYTCDVCGETKTEEIDKLVPVITEGNNGTYQQGGKDGLTFTSDATFTDFISVSVDGNVLDAANYTLKEGSTIVTLTADYLATLSVGKHTLAIDSTNGTATTEFTITAKAIDSNEPEGSTNADDPESPDTGDTSNTVLWTALLFLSCGALTTLGVSKKYKKGE